MKLNWWKRKWEIVNFTSLPIWIKEIVSIFKNITVVKKNWSLLLISKENMKINGVNTSSNKSNLYSREHVSCLGFVVYQCKNSNSPQKTALQLSFHIILSHNSYFIINCFEDLFVNKFWWFVISQNIETLVWLWQPLSKLRTFEVSVNWCYS